MRAYDYVALDVAGKKKIGTIKADSDTAAQQELTRRQLLPVRLTPSTNRVESAKAGAGGQRLSARDLVHVTRQAATLLRVNPVEEALRAIANQADNKRIGTVLHGVHAQVVEGFRLSEAMNRFPTSFPPLYRSMVAIGESVGVLPDVLDRMADLQERELEINSKIQSALIYPAILTIMAILVVFGMMGFVVPKMVVQLESLGQTLPLITRIVVGCSRFLQNFGPILVIAGAGGMFVFLRALRAEAFRRKFDRFVLGLPLIGRAVRFANASHLARSLATMSGSGLPVLEGLTIAAKTVQNLVLRDAVERMCTMIREGASLSTSMRKVEIFPSVLVHMAASGEASSNLAPMLERAADYVDREINALTDLALRLLEPLIIVIMGLVVAIIVLAVLLPILQVNSAVLR